MDLNTTRINPPRIPATAGAESYVCSEFGEAYILISEDESLVEVLLKGLPDGCLANDFDWLESVCGGWHRLAVDLSRLSAQGIVDTVSLLLNTLGEKPGIEEGAAA